MKPLRVLTPLRLVDAVSRFAAAGGALALAGMVGLLGWEVAMRLVAGQGTVWAFDLTWMAMAAVFALGLGQAARSDRFAAMTLAPAGLRARVRGAVELCAMAPLVAGAAWFGWSRALLAFRFGGVDQMSSWGPKLWPFLALLAAGLTLFAVQLGADGLRRILGGAAAPAAGRRDRA